MGKVTDSANLLIFTVEYYVNSLDIFTELLNSLNSWSYIDLCGCIPVSYITLKQSLKLLDLKDSGAWGAGSVAAMAVDGRRKLTQAWSRYFYENPDLYDCIDGLIFNNAHDGQLAIALYERAMDQLSSADISTLNLNEPAIRESILTIANRLNLPVEIEL